MTSEPPTESGAAPTIPVYSDYPPNRNYARSHPLQRRVVGASKRKSHLPLIAVSLLALAVLVIVGVFGYRSLLARGKGNALNTSQPTATPIATTAPTATPSPAPTASPTAILHSTVIFQDPLTSNTYGWEVDPPNCYFGADGYHVSNNFVCLAPITQTLTDITVSVQATQVSGPDNVPYGLTLRHMQKGSYYDFDVRSDGYWEFIKYQAGTLSKMQDYTFSSAVVQGVGQTNALKVVMRGATFDCYINNNLVATITDASVASGDVGVFGGPNETAFTNYLVTAP